MHNLDLHKATLIDILKAIYGNVDIRTVLGFKGGTAAMLFYDLPRISVDLDFDLLNENKKEIVFATMKTLLATFGDIIEATDKHYTLFYILRYQKGERLLKVDISKRTTGTQYETKQYLGIPMLVARQEDMTAGKLAALLTRNRFAARDIFDLWYFLSNHWPISSIVVKEKTTFSLNEALQQAIDKVEKLNQTQLLQGLGDLLNEKQRGWARAHLQKDLLFSLRFYLQNENEKNG